MIKNRLFVRALALFAGAALVFAACGDDDDDEGAADEAPEVESALFQEAQDEGLTLGIAEEPPYGFTDPDTDEADGEAPTVAKAVLEELGITNVKTRTVDFGALINGLRAGQFDIIAAGMFITEERASQALFTDPDYCATQSFAVPEGNPQNVTDFESVVANKDIKLGVLRGAVEEGFASDAGIEKDRISVFDTPPDMQDALTSGRINAYALTSISVEDQTATMEGFEGTEPFEVPGVKNCGGYVFRQDDKDARDEFNEVLVELRDNKELASLLEDFAIFEETDSLSAAVGVSVEDVIGKPYDFAVK